MLVGADALHAVQRGLLKRLHVGVARSVPGRAELAALGDEPGGRLGGFERGVQVVVGGRAAGLAHVGLERLAERNALAGDRGDGLGVEVDVRERGEQRIGDEGAGGRRVEAERLGVEGDDGDAAARIHEQVLQRRDVRRLAAHTDLLAGGPVGRLLALVAEHDALVRGHSRSFRRSGRGFQGIWRLRVVLGLVLGVSRAGCERGGPGAVPQPRSGEDV